MRTIVLGNGNMLLTLDSNATVRDFYYPYVGEENHMGFPGLGIKLGVYENEQGAFSWVNERWEKHFSYVKDTLVCEVVLINHNLNVKITINSFVDHELNAYVKKIKIRNIGDSEKEFRLFISHDYNIYESVVADTAIYDPHGEIVHFKKDRYFLHASQPTFDQFATGKTDQGYHGTWKDAEDGILSGNLVAQGNVDSVIGFTLQKMKSHEEREIFYWIAVGKNYDEVVDLHKRIKEKTPEMLLKENIEYWTSWVNSTSLRKFADLGKAVKKLYLRSLLTIRTHVDNRGSIIASCDSDIMQFNLDYYNYCWPRDASWIAMALDRAGYSELTRRYFKFCAKIIDNGFFAHKYWSSGDKASTWHPLPSLQEDETAIVLTALYKNYLVTKDIESLHNLYEKIVVPAADKLSEFLEYGLPKPSWDLWEERKGVHCYTTCTVISALRSAAEIAKVLGHADNGQKWLDASNIIMEHFETFWDSGKKRYLRSINDDKNDSSVSALFLFDILPVDDHRLGETMASIKHDLMRPSGVVRYDGDTYHGYMNAWPICTLWYAEWCIKKAKNKQDLKEAKELIEKVASLASESGMLAEQYDDNGNPKSVMPLTWAHATFVLAIKEYIERFYMLRY